MKLTDTKLKETILTIAITTSAIVTVCLIFISPIAKYLIEKYDVKYTGRQITMDWAYVNPFTGYIHIVNLRIAEASKDTLFFSAEGVSANFAMRKLIFKNVEITELNVDHPIGIIIQKKDNFNFNDLIKRFSSKKDTTDSGKNNSSVHVSINNISITDGLFHYVEKITPIKYFIEKVNLQCSGIRWDADTIASTFTFLSRGGKTSGAFTINTKTLDYKFATVIKDQDLEIIRQYLWELINYGMFKAHLDADIKAYGNFKDTRRLTMKGRLAFSDFHLGKTTTYDYASFKKLLLVMDELSPASNKFLFDSVTLDKSYFSFEHFDSLDNIQAMFGKQGANVKDVTAQSGRFNLVIAISRYIKKLAKDFFVSQYRVNALSLTDGEVKYVDYALNEKFSIAAQHVYLKADSISKTNKRVHFNLKFDVYPYGNSSARLSLNPLDSGDIDFNYHLNKVPVTVFNPYIISYTSFPLDKGTLNMNGTWKVRNGEIKSENQLVLVKPHVARKLKSKDTKKKFPLPLIMAFIRERGDVINYKIPITGSLRDPKFNFGDVFIDLFKNIFIKPPTLPYALQVKSKEKKIDESFQLIWPTHQTSLSSRQEKFLKKLANFLEENKEASIEVYTQQYVQREKEHILFFETKKKHFLTENNKKSSDFTENDSIKVEKMSVKDLGHDLVKDMVKITRDTTMFTIHDKCHHYLGSDIVDHKFNQLIKAREHTFLSYFADTGANARVKMHSTKDIIPYNGFSCFQIKYKGDMPKSLKEPMKILMK